MKGLFIGAGFSCEFGLPLVWDLTEELRNFFTPAKIRNLNQTWLKQGGGFSEKVILKIIELFEQKQIHYEWIVGALEIEGNRYENKDIRNELHHIRSILLEFIFILLHQRIVKNENYIKASLGMHRGLKSLISDNYPLWIFSLNHDLIIEILASEFNIPLRNGFSEETIKLSFDFYGKENAEFAKLNMHDGISYPYNYFLPNQKGINLLKMHGSLDIFGYDDLRQYLCVMPKEKSLKGYIDMLNILVEKQNTGLPKATNEIIVFDDKKEIQFLRMSILSGVYKFKNQQTQVVSMKILNLFKSSLNYIDELIVIGYGFGDIHVNLILREWLEATSKRKLRIINPYQEKIPDFIGHLYAQVSIQAERSIDYFSSLSDGSLSNSEKLIYMIRKKSREK